MAVIKEDKSVFFVTAKFIGGSNNQVVKLRKNTIICENPTGNKKQNPPGWRVLFKENGRNNYSTINLTVLF